MSDQIFYLFSAMLLGLVIGALIMYFSAESNRDSDKTIAKLEKKLNIYQENVAEHFEETANLVDDLTQSYKKVFDHMGKSARLLMTDEQIQEQIEKRKGNKVILEFLTEESDNSDEDAEIFHVADDYDNSETEEDFEVSEGELGSEELVESSENNQSENETLEDLKQEVKIREKNIYT